MTFHQSGEIRYYTFDLLSNSDVTHAIFTRRGGVSPEPWHSLNMGGTVGDERENAEVNRRLAFQAVGRDPDSLYDVWQVHSADVVVAKAPRPPDQPHLKADAILTDNPSVTLFMRFADCVPILLYDPYCQVVGLVHAGWQGTVKGTARNAVVAMVEQFGSRPVNILAGIGPSIGAHHYEIGPEVVAQVQEAFGNRASSLLPSQNGSVKFDLWQANRLLLRNTGVRSIKFAGLCTACRLDDWFSHRGEQGKTGRFGVLIGLNRNV